LDLPPELLCSDACNAVEDSSATVGDGTDAGVAAGTTTADEATGEDEEDEAGDVSMLPALKRPRPSGTTTLLLILLLFFLDDTLVHLSGDGNVASTAASFSDGDEGVLVDTSDMASVSASSRSEPPFTSFTFAFASTAFAGHFRDGDSRC
jgi:hypothetical protein